MTKTPARRRALLAASLGALLPAAAMLREACADASTPGLAGGPASSKNPKHHKESRKMATERKVPEPPASTLALREHVDRMRLYFSVPYTHKPDRDFAALLAAHYRGLSELAQIELKHGTDPEMRALAQRIVDGHAATDATLQEWRKRQPN